MPAKKHVAPELIAEGKFLYEETLTPTDEIGAKMGLSRSAFYLRVKEWNWKRRRYSSGIAADSGEPIRPAAGATPLVEKIARADAAAPGEVKAVTPELRAALYARIYRAALQQMDAIDSVQQTLRPGQAAESERTVRIVATINKMLIEIAALNKPDETTPPDETTDDSVPRDIDEFRNELARRINAIVDAQRAGERAGDFDADAGADAERR